MSTDTTQAGQPISESKKMKVGNVEISIDTLTDEEAAQRRWDKFQSKYSEERRIMITVRNSRLQSKVNMIIVGKLGQYDEKNWDIYCPDGERTIGYYINERIEEGDIRPVIYILGISDSVPEERFLEVKRKINKLKLTN